MASAPAAVIGEPPNVEIELPCRLSMISARAMTPPTDRPFPMPLANVTMSGVAPPWACACQPQKCSPVRPQPVCTSSLIHRMPCSPSSLANAPSSPSGPWVNPPTPWIGSAISAATSPPAWSSTSRRSATQASTNSASASPANGLRKRLPPCT